MQELYTPAQIQSILQPVFTEHNIKKAVLFGSYAKGAARAQSDIDILVDSGLKGLAFFGLLEDVVTSLGKSVGRIPAHAGFQGGGRNQEKRGSDL